MKATSFSRNAAAGAAACNLDFHVVLPGTESEQNPLSQALFMQWDAKIHYEPKGESALTDCQERVVASLKEQGKNVYLMHPGGSNPIGALSYIHAFQEILDFSYRSRIHFSHIIHSTSSAGTQAGLVVGQCISNYDTKIIGISASLNASAQSERIRDLVWPTAEKIGASIDQEKVFVDDSDPRVASVTEIWSCADWFEREAFDLFGILFDGHPDLRRLLTDYGFIGHPFRKDFPLIGHVEMRYDPERKRVIYEPVSIEPRINNPRVIRHDNRYEESSKGK